MSIENSDQLVSKIEMALGSSSSLFVSNQLEFAASQAINELGWSYPIEISKKQYWAVLRGKRHALDLKRTETAHKFKYKQISLNQRFEHYNALIRFMDEEFERAASRDPVLLDVEYKDFFGTYINNGFIYDQYGNDISRLMSDLGADNNGYRTRYI